MRFRSIFLGCLLVSAFSANARAASPSVTLADCMTDGGNSGDNPDHGFYFRSYPAENLSTVTLAVINSGAAGDTLTLTAHHGTYDGAVIGVATASVSVTSGGDHRVTLDFGGVATTPGETIAFVLTAVTDAGSMFIDYGNDGPCAVIETEGTGSGLDTFRRGSFGVVVTTLAPTLTSVTPSSGVTAGGSAVTLNGANFQAPSNVTFGTASVTGAITIGADGGNLGVTTPAHATGSIDVTVTTLYANDGGVDASAVTTLAAGYTYGDVAIPADSGSISTTDGGGATTTRDDAGTDDSDNGDSSGCGCRVVGEDSSASMAGAIFVGFVALLGLRRSKKR